MACKLIVAVVACDVLEKVEARLQELSVPNIAVSKEGLRGISELIF